MESDPEGDQAEMTWRGVLRSAVRTLRGRRVRRNVANPPVPPAADWPRWLASRAGAVPLYGRLNTHEVMRFAESHPRAAAKVIAAADSAIAHTFTLLGQSFTPRDPDRVARGGYFPIDWRRDPACASRFPGGFPHTAWNLQTMRPGAADVKVPWELARCHHWVNLAQSWRLTGGVEYAREVQQQCEDFIEANPIGVGIQWTCTMDVAIRAVNWVLAWELLEPCDALDADFRIRWAQALYSHGVFIRANLENTYEVTSNHYLSNVVGLFFLGQFFVGTEAGQSWLPFARTAIEHEMITQVLEDGSDFESSIPYHRLVTELLLGAARVAQVHGPSFSVEFNDSLHRMVAFLAAVVRPDGLMPQVGDADDGRLHVFEGMGQWQPQDPRHLFTPASYILGELDWKELGGEASGAEAVWWGFPLSVASVSSAPAVDALFQYAGIAVSRCADTYLLITNGVVGTRGFGNHKHNDLLSFEFHADGVPWFVDPGSYVYTSDLEARNLFRSVRSHNTLRIDEREQNEMNPEWLFRLFESASPEHRGWQVDADRVRYTGAHQGYLRDGGPTHERRFLLDRRSGGLEIVDVLSGGIGRRRAVWHFHCNPGVEAHIAPHGIVLSSARRVRVLRARPGLTATLGDGWYSPSYGVRVACRTIEFATTLALPDPSEWRFSFGA